MNKLPTAKEVAEEVLIEDFGGSLAKRITQDRDLAYTSLIEGIEGMKLIAKTTAQFMNKCPYNEALTDIIRLCEEWNSPGKR